MPDSGSETSQRHQPSHGTSAKSGETSSRYILIYTQDMPDRPEYLAWLLSWPVHLMTSSLEWSSLIKFLDGLCGEMYCLLELDSPCRSYGVYPPSKKAFTEIMSKINPQIG